jgi:hypothetical protein
MKHHKIQIQPNLLILNAPKREMKTRDSPNIKIHGKKQFFIPHFGAFPIMQ